jgi:hypothetical protein
VTASTVKTAAMEASAAEASVNVMKSKTMPVEMVQAGVMMIAASAEEVITIPVRSPDPKIRTGVTPIYITSVTPREEQRDRYEAKRYF